VPKKNIIDFHGKPLLAYTIEAAIKSKLFRKHIYVSSDSDEILRIAETYHGNGVRGVRRPDDISGDSARLEDAAFHLLKAVAGTFDNLCLLIPSFPLRNAEDVRGAYRTLLKEKAGCVMTVTDYQWLTPFWAMQEKNGFLDFFFGRKYLVQDSKTLPKSIYCLADAVRWVRVPSFLKERTFHSKRIVKHEIPFERSIEIDDLKDFELAKKLFKIVDL
jgi:CMP-N-acetylneuraminic acid synthetase